MKRVTLCLAILATLASPAFAKSDHAAHPHGNSAVSQNDEGHGNKGRDHDNDQGDDNSARELAHADQATLLMNLFSSPEARSQLKAQPSKNLMKRLRESGILLPNQQAYFIPPGIAKKLPALPPGRGRVIVDGTAFVIDLNTGAMILNLGKLF